jgi:hypothetical protein
MQSAFDYFNECRSTLRMTTGSAVLDSLIDSIKEGQFYLFYGNNRTILDGLVHGLLVNCVLTIREHGFESMAVYTITSITTSQPDCFLNPVNNKSLRIVVNKRHSLDGLFVSYPLSLFLHVL